MNKKFLFAIAICAVVYLSLGFGVVNKYVLKLGEPKEEGTKATEETVSKGSEQQVTETPDTSQLQMTEEEKESPSDTSAGYTKTTSTSSTTKEVSETKTKEDTSSSSSSSELNLDEILGGGGSSSSDEDDLLGGISGN